MAQLWAKPVGAVRLRALPFFLVQLGCLRVGVSRCGLAAVVGGGVRCFVGVNLPSYPVTNVKSVGLCAVLFLSCVCMRGLFFFLRIHSEQKRPAGRIVVYSAWFTM